MSDSENPMVELGYMAEQFLVDDQEVLSRQPVELERHWEQKFGTYDKRVARARKHRQEVIRDALYAKQHHKRFSSCIDKIEAVDVESPTANLEIYKWSKAAELHRQAMNKYVPDIKAVEVSVDEDTKAAAEGVSRAAEILERIAGTRRDHHNARTGPVRSVVSPALPPEAGGSGDGSEA